MRLIASEFCGRLDTFGHLEIVFFNYYRYWPLIVLRNGNGTAIVIHSRESVTQGDRLAMIAYRIGILLLIKNMKWAIPDITQP